MALGGLTLTNHGNYHVSGATLKTVVDAIVLSGAAATPASIHFVDAGGGTVQVLEVDVATT